MSSRPEIAVQQQEYLSFLPLVRQQFGAIPGVDIIGLGAKERKGRATQEWAFRFYVQQKRPLKEIPASERIPKTILGVKTDVIQHFEKVDLVTAPGLLIPEDPTDYRDTGIRGGIQIRNEYFSDKINSGYGTMGVLARTVVGNKLVGLTCAHVVNSAADTATSIGHKIGHPKYHLSCCCCHHGWIGDVLLATANVDLDCALIEIHSDVAALVAAHTTENKVAKDAAGGTDTITGAAAFLCFDIVSKYGRGTGYTTGNVIDVAYGTNQMLVTPIALGGVFAGQGDSGAVLLNSSKQVLGLVVAAAMDHTVAGPVAMTNAIVTLIKPIMQNLNITIAGTAHASIGDPVMGGGVGGCELFAWPGGQTDPNLNPSEPFLSSDFGFVGPVDWDVSTGPAGAVIVEADGAAVANLTSVNGATAVKIRYNTVSTSKNLTDAVRIKATSGVLAPVNKFRTVFKFVPQAVKTAGALDVDDALRFAANGGTITNAGAAVPGTDGAIHYRAKAEIIYDILPADITWSGSAAIAFVNGTPAGLKGNIISRRQTKFTKGEQTAAAANRTHTFSDWTDSLEACAADNFQGASDAHPGKVFRLSNEGVDPATFRQFYLRALYRDYLEVHNGTSWIRVTPYAEWWANLTGGLNAVAPPNVVAPNTIGAGTDATLIPNQQPVVTPGAVQDVKFGQVGVSISATAVDADNDVLTPIAWTQTSGTVVVLTGSPGSPVTFTAPSAETTLKFSPVTKDSTETLPRTAGNHQSAAVEVVVNVAEWKNIGGGDPVVTRNMTEVFTAASYAIGAGALNWDVSTGGVGAMIVEKDGAPIAAVGSVVGASSIKVRFDTQSGDITMAQAVKIKATHVGSGTVKSRYRTVFRVTMAIDASDPLSHKIPSTLGAAGIDHFCTAKGAGNMVFKATIAPVPANPDMNWTAVGRAITVPSVGGDRTTAHIDRGPATGLEIPFKVQIQGDDVYAGKAWMIWGTVGAVARPFATPRTAIGLNISGGYNFTVNLEPLTIIPAIGVAEDVPDLTGANTNPPPDVPVAEVDVYQAGRALGGGADKKWDITRRAKQKVLNPNAVVWRAGVPLAYRTTYISYPANAVAGNDDTHTMEALGPEDNIPYTAPGHRQLTGMDQPSDSMRDTEGADGDTVEIRFHCQEFGRVELNGNWYVITDGFNWRIHFSWIKIAGAWQDNGSLIETNNTGF